MGLAPLARTGSPPVRLDPWNGTDPLRYVPLLKGASACAADWRVVELYSTISGGTGRPFDARLEWTNGDGSGAYALVTVPRMTRVCVLARSLDVFVANLANVPHDVGVNVGDAFLVTRNVHEMRGTGQVAAPSVTLDPPPFAEAFRLECDTPAALPTYQIKLVDGVGIPRLLTTGNVQPDTWLPCSDAGAIDLAPVAATNWRVIFRLSL